MAELVAVWVVWVAWVVLEVRTEANMNIRIEIEELEIEIAEPLVYQ